jgi:hypothetical protein
MIIEAAVITLLATATEWRNGGDYVQRFVVPGSPYVSTVTRRLGAVAGVVYDAAGSPRDLDGSKATQIPHCIAPEPPAAADTVSAMSRQRAIAPEHVVIDLMELYTFAAENGAGGRAPIEAKIAAAVDLLNSTLLQSKIYNVSFRLNYTGRVDREENINQLQLLNWLTNDAGVARLRADHGADLVGLWTEADAEIAWAPRTFTPSSGFHVICRRYPLSLQLFSHEVAHNLGAQHNVEQCGNVTNDPYPYARGIVSAKWMTVMSYPPPGEWRDVLPIFSNPDLQRDGMPLGIPEHADNARMIRLASPIVADYFHSADGLK